MGEARFSVGNAGNRTCYHVNDPARRSRNQIVIPTQKVTKPQRKLVNLTVDNSGNTMIGAFFFEQDASFQKIQ